ncbi:acyl carrier protein [Desulfosporosinus acididurans]|uniref:Acyl carrier protein n=1 Tax=Desulfosporosinus acididurans TaxID=476652 RepID=A0A0J1FNM3_9FIRM|nr:acyl carrier protein [Desulfosporosinus acididurans]KLU65065.1 acyl carrier protein [Desulfosporosinus acididurans]
MDDLKSITAKVLGIGVEEVTESLTRNKSEGWDSFGHMMLINEIETQLNIKFTMKEVEELQTFQQLQDLVLAKRGA